MDKKQSKHIHSWLNKLTWDWFWSLILETNGIKLHKCWNSFRASWHPSNALPTRWCKHSALNASNHLFLRNDGSSETGSGRVHQDYEMENNGMLSGDIHYAVCFLKHAAAICFEQLLTCRRQDAVAEILVQVSTLS